MDLTVALREVNVHDRTETEFTAFFVDTWPRLFRTIYGIAGDTHSAEDALQSAFAKAYASWRRVSAADRPDAYVLRMAINEVLGVRRRAWWRAERPTAVPEPQTSADAHEPGFADRDAVWQAVLALPARQRAVIVLRYYEDLSEQTIAETLGCSRGTVKSQAAAALKKLRNLPHMSVQEDS
jgi:RNA polymerase sigma-70 factor (sigma-E family)